MSQTQELTIHGLPVEIVEGMKGDRTALMADGVCGAVIHISPAMADLLGDKQTRDMFIVRLRIEDTRISLVARIEALEMKVGAMERKVFGDGE